MSNDSGLTPRQVAAIAAAAAATGAAVSIAFSLWGPRPRQQRQQGGSATLGQQVSPPRMSPPLSPFQAARQQQEPLPGASGSISTVSRCWDWLSSSQDALPPREASSSSVVRAPSSATRPTANSAQQDAAKSGSFLGSTLGSSTLGSVLGSAPLGRTASKAHRGGLEVKLPPSQRSTSDSAAFVAPVSEPPSVHTPSQHMTPPDPSVRLPSDSSVAWLDAMSAGGLASLRAPSAHSIFGSTGQFGSSSVQQRSGSVATGDEHGSGPHPVEAPRRRSLDASRSDRPAERALLSDPDFVASLPAAPELAAGTETAWIHAWSP